jgi:hypothetical protein
MTDDLGSRDVRSLELSSAFSNNKESKIFLVILADDLPGTCDILLEEQCLNYREKFGHMGGKAPRLP